MLETVIKFLREEFAIVKSAPLAFFVLLVIAFFLSRKTLEWQYAGETEALRAQVGLYEVTVHEYRERLGLVSDVQSKYSKLSNAELRKIALGWVSRLQSLITDYKSETNSQQRPFTGNLTEEQRTREMNRFTSLYRKTSDEYQERFESTFRGEFIALRDEILNRLPRGSANEMPKLYELADGFWDWKEISMDLDRIARLLPVADSD